MDLIRDTSNVRPKFVDKAQPWKVYLVRSFDLVKLVRGSTLEVNGTETYESGSYITLIFRSGNVFETYFFACWGVLRQGEQLRKELLRWHGPKPSTIGLVCQ
jgi:hypothetical protein